MGAPAFRVYREMVKYLRLLIPSLFTSKPVILSGQLVPVKCKSIDEFD